MPDSVLNASHCNESVRHPVTASAVIVRVYGRLWGIVAKSIDYLPLPLAVTLGLVPQFPHVRIRVMTH